MKLGKSKLALAKVINENGGWPQDSEWVVQNGDHGRISLSINKPVRHDSKSWMAKGGFNFKIEVCKPLKNWHQCVLNREEYYQAYPKADSDGWIECIKSAQQVDGFSVVDVRFRDGGTAFGQAHVFDWSVDGGEDDIIAYRLHKPEAKPEFCESVMRSIPEPEAKPTIEQLAQDYRNKLDFAKRKQQEADDAKAASDAALVELELAGEAAGLLVSPIREDVKPQPTITEWRELKIGDEVKYINGTTDECNGMVGAICKIDGRPECGRYRIKVLFDKISCWCDRWEFIQRP